MCVQGILNQRQGYSTMLQAFGIAIARSRKNSVVHLQCGFMAYHYTSVVLDKVLQTSVVPRN